MRALFTGRQSGKTFWLSLWRHQRADHWLLVADHARAKRLRLEIKQVRAQAGETVSQWDLERVVSVAEMQRYMVGRSTREFSLSIDDIQDVLPALLDLLGYHGKIDVITGTMPVATSVTQFDAFDNAPASGV